jgi:uncharacterized protein YjiS (DUF1127 family)
MTSYLATLFRRSAQRKAYTALMNLDDHLLRDIGVTRADVHQLISGGRAAHRSPGRSHE